MTGLRPIELSSFTIVSNGHVDGPAQALRDYLIRKKARRLTTIFHPLLSDDQGRHEITIFQAGRTVTKTTRRIPFPVPLSYVLDPFIPLRIPRSDIWFGFNNLAAARGLLSKGLHKTEQVIYWCVDFVPDRFGRTVLTRAYDLLDRACSRQADVRVELSEAAAKGRAERLAVPDRQLAPVRIVPMGSWLDRVPKTSSDAYRQRRIVYMGHLVPRQGVTTLIEALSILSSRGVDFEADILGRGPLEEELRARSSELGLDERVRFHGFVEKHEDLEVLLASASVAAAPYKDDQDSFTRFADPGKLKAYLGAGLPIIMTSVPPNSAELENHAGVEVVAPTAEAFAQAIADLLDSPTEWERRRSQALDYIQAFDWNVLLADLLRSTGFE